MDDHIIVFDDDKNVSELIDASLPLTTVAISKNSELFDLSDELNVTGIFLDIHIGCHSGLDSIPYIKSRWPNSVLIVMTSDPSDHHFRRAFSLGCDDFIKKPLIPSEINSRYSVRYSVKNEIYSYGDLKLFKKKRTLSGPDGSMLIGPIECEILKLLIDQRGSVSKSIIKNNIWHRSNVDDHTFHSRIYNLRKSMKKISSCYQIKVNQKSGVNLTGANEPNEL